MIDLAATRGMIADKSMPVTETGCWIWLGSVNGNKRDHRVYGIIVSKRNVPHKLAHRASYEAHIGPIPEGKMICHKCDTRLCVNPAHLYAGTAKDNGADMANRNRHADCTGEQNAHAKLTRDQIDSIRSEYRSGITQVKLADHYDVGQSHISRIIRGEQWS